jgi:guanine deaminase
MCLSAIYWARLDAVWFSADHNDATSAGFDDARIYKELALESQFRSLPQLQIALPEALESFQIWKALPEKTEY